MAKPKQQAALAADSDATIPRIKLGETGIVGLRSAGNNFNGMYIYEELKKELNFPQCIPIYKRMSYDSTISSALNLFETMLKKAEWYVEPPANATDTQKQRAEFIATCMKDMEHSWLEFISEVSSYMTYGFSVHEKVYRRRYSSNGSLYNDGYVGWRKLAVRSQDTISGWKFSDDGRELLGVFQNLNIIQNGTNQYGKLANAPGNRILTSRDKFLLIRSNGKRGNPEGNSVLRQVYFNWKYRTQIEETEAIGIQRDMGGLPVMGIPARYMSPDATEEEKAVYQQFMNIGRNIQSNTQSSIVFPLQYDPDSKQPLFTFKLLGVEGAGGKLYDTDAIINRYDSKILMVLSADLLKLGLDGSGSFALSDNKRGLVNMALEARLTEIADVLNSDLVRQTFALNGWTDSELPKICFDLPDTKDLEKFAKAVQQISAVGLVEVERDVLNVIREELFDLPPKATDLPVDKQNLTMADTGSAEGMATAGEGTATKPSGKDTTASNVSNK